jgi:hypothetical protein
MSTEGSSPKEKGTHAPGTAMLLRPAWVLPFYSLSDSDIRVSYSALRSKNFFTINVFWGLI